MNSTLINIIYTSNYKKGKEKMQEIIKEKQKLNIPIITQYKEKDKQKIIFLDETWIILNPILNKSRCYRYKKCYIDINIPLDIRNKKIFPYGIRKTQKEEYF